MRELNFDYHQKYQSNRQLRNLLHQGFVGMKTTHIEIRLGKVKEEESMSLLKVASVFMNCNNIIHKLS